MSFSKNEINVILINNTKELIENYEFYYKNSEYIGIDTEWRDSLCIYIKTQTAIMQLSDYDGKNIFILDILELIKEQNFKNIFENLFKEKTFISFGFNGDLETLPDELNNFFKGRAKIIDITDLYQIKFLEKCP